MTPRPRERSGRRAALPLVSSQEVVAALRRLGFDEARSSRGSHLSMARPRDDGGKDVTIVVLNRKEVPRGTLQNILDLAGVSREDFLRALGKRRR